MFNKCSTADWGALFDLDGVLIDTEGSYTVFWHRIDEMFPTGVENFEYVIKGSNLQSILSNYFPDKIIQSQILEALEKHENEMDYCFFDGVAAFLHTLKCNHVKMAVVTSSNALKMSRLESKLPELCHIVDTIVTGDDVAHSKPHPEGYHIAASRLGLSPGRCVVFEDSLAGVEAGRRAGGAVVGLATTCPRERLSDFADVVFDSFEEIEFEAIGKLINRKSRL